jgi:pimeloyl-ACP methyl ester carboxylesterase
MQAQRTPDHFFANLAGWSSYAPHYVEDLAGYDGLRMHYVDEGPRKADVTFLCLHGEPSWAYLYRKMIPIFAGAGHRVIAPDLFGFGRSDKPVEDSAYTYHFHRNSLLRFVERLDLRNVCLVVQDWGGILGLTLPVAAPERYTRLVVMNTALPAGEIAGTGFEAWRAFNRGRSDLDIAALMKRWSSPILSDAEAAAYGAPFPDQSYKGGVRRFPELVMWTEGEGRELTPDAAEGLQTSLQARKFWAQDWTGASFMAIGMKDPVLGPPVMQSLRDLIRNCPEPLQIPAAGHFVQEWGDRVAEAALDSFGLL